MVDQAGAVRLVDAVLHGDAQVLQVAGEQRGRHQRRAREVVDRVLAGIRRGQHAARLLGLELKRRDHNRKADLFRNRHTHAVDAPPLHRGGDEAARDRGARVVGVPFDLRREVDEVGLRERRPEHTVRAEDARHDAGRAAAEAAGHRDVVFLNDPEARKLLAADLIEVLRRPVDQVGFIGRHLHVVGRRDLQRVGLLHPDAVVHRERDAEGVEAGAEVGAGGRNIDSNHRGRPFSQ